MQAHTWLGGTHWPWCVAACVTWLEEAGFKLPYQGAGAWAFLDWARKAGWAVPASKAIPGDLVVWGFGSGHMSMLTQPVAAGRVLTIDGNVDDAVEYRNRPISLVRGFIHIPELHSAPPAKPPVFEVVGSASGHKVIYVSGARAIGRNLSRFLKNHPNGVVIRNKRPR